jgi:hypothetical protein
MDASVPFTGDAEYCKFIEGEVLIVAHKKSTEEKARNNLTDLRVLPALPFFLKYCKNSLISREKKIPLRPKKFKNSLMLLEKSLIS